MRKRSFFYGILILVFLISATVFAMAAGQDSPTQNGKPAGEVFLYTGSPLILSDGKIQMLDSTNPDMGATVVQSRTLLPLRSVSEYFGAAVTYNSAAKEVTIKYNGREYLFPIGSKTYTVKDGMLKKEYTMDTQTMIVDGRTMVPLRVVSENVLEMKVSYYDRVIAVADHEIDLKSNMELVSDVRSKIGEAVKARTMAELGKVLTAEQKLYYKSDIVDNAPVVRNSTADAGANFGAAAEETTDREAQTQPAADDSSYSTTNTQVEGIDEADIVKTDGKYLYLAGNNAVRIVGADQGKLSDDTTIRLATDKNISEIYIDGSRLVILGTRTEYIKNNASEPKEVINNAADQKMIGIIMPPYRQSKTFSFADVYDISNPLKPIFLKGHEMEGSYLSSRKNGDVVYLVTNTYPSGIVLPMMRDTTIGSQEFSMKLDDVMIMPNHPSPGYLVVSAVNIKNNDKTEVEAITAYGAIMYMNDSSLYLTFNNQNGNTSVIKFDLNGMKVGYAGSGEVPGYLLNQFSMDEYKGNLRVATTDWQTSSNGLYVLDRSLNVVGSVKNLAKGESIYSVRFLGDKGYVVTYKTIDPLFVFDLSDPQKPFLTGEVEVPGFSSYLHPVGDNLLLGIGMDTYDIYRKDNAGKDIVVGTRQGGIKFSLFDISDMGKPKEIAKYVVGDSGSSTEALYNHKAIMVDPTNGNVAIDAYLNFENQNTSYQQGAIVMNYSGKKLTLKGILNSDPSGVYGNYIPYGRRIMYIGDVLYYIQDGRISSYHYDTLKQIDTLTLQ
jgi:Secreted protein containing C-terminal beta-propeller domain distantly related to WD-40 repeats